VPPMPHPSYAPGNNYVLSCFTFFFLRLRSKLDRRRLEEAHFRYAILNVVRWYPDQILTEAIFMPDMKDTLSKFFAAYQHAFHSKYSGIYIALIAYSGTSGPLIVSLNLYWSQVRGWKG
jgi:hypothetical protein